MEQQLADIALLGSEEEREELQDMITEVHDKHFKAATARRILQSCLALPCAGQHVFCMTSAPVHVAASASVGRQHGTADMLSATWTDSHKSTAIHVADA